MENKNSQGTPVLAKKVKITKGFMFLLCLIFIILLSYIVGGLLLSKNGFGVSQEQMNAEVSAYFKDCKVLSSNCSSSDCGFYDLCGNGELSVCKIYDCGNDYGVFTENTSGDINLKKEAKNDENSVQAQKEACSGSLQVLDQQCVDGKMQIDVKLNTKEQCKIGGFTLVYEGLGAQPNSFSAKDDGAYSITADTCGDIKEIIPQTEEGIAIF